MGGLEGPCPEHEELMPSLRGIPVYGGGEKTLGTMGGLLPSMWDPQCVGVSCFGVCVEGWFPIFYGGLCRTWGLVPSLGGRFPVCVGGSGAQPKAWGAGT